MDINSYLNQFSKSSDYVRKFAQRCGTSVAYIGHVRKGRRVNQKLETVLAFLRESDCQISIRSLRPDLFGANKKGRQNVELLKRALDEIDKA